MSPSKFLIEQDVANKYNLITCATFTGYIFQYCVYLMKLNNHVNSVLCNCICNDTISFVIKHHAY